MGREYTRHRRVEPILPSQQSQDCLKKQKFLNGENESEKKKPTESQEQQQQEELGYTPSASRTCEMETPLYSDYLESAGTVDCIADFRGKRSVIDFKTSKRVKSRDNIHDYFIQTSAYAVAFEERTRLPVSQLVIIMAVDNEDPLVFVEKRDDWIDGYLELRKQYKKWKGY